MPFRRISALADKITPHNCLISDKLQTEETQCSAYIMHAQLSEIKVNISLINSVMVAANRCTKYMLQFVNSHVKQASSERWNE